MSRLTGLLIIEPDEHGDPFAGQSLRYNDHQKISRKTTMLYMKKTSFKDMSDRGKKAGSSLE